MTSAAANRAQKIARVAVPVPLSGLFDYLMPEQGPEPVEGGRVAIQFGRRQMVGLFCGYRDHSDLPADKLRPIDEVIDTEAILPADLMALANKASRYYHHPIGEVFSTILPNALIQGKPLDAADEPLWVCSETGKQTDPETLNRAPKQKALLNLFQSSEHALGREALNEFSPQWRTALKALEDKQLLETLALPPLVYPRINPSLPLNDEQRIAVDTVKQHDGFGCFLLNGITGSGKTEVYLQLITQALENNQQVLILVPEIGLTPQLLERVSARFEATVVNLHSNMTDLERLRAWRLASQGRAHIVLGTRSALFTPLPRPGLIIIDEEHDPSLKQQDGFRYHARDLAVMRAQQQNIPIVMGSATPALESLQNIKSGRYTELCLTQRAGDARPPRIAVIDARVRDYRYALGTHLRQSMKKHLEQGHQVLLFLNRRGYAPSLSCPSCGWHAQCHRCDSHLTLHHQPHRLRCHHCGTERRPESACPDCQYQALETIGLGTEQLEEELGELFPDYPTIRIDRDSTRRKGSLEAQLKKIHDGEARILIGTQMLAKGHHFPKVTLVGILDCDRGLFSADFRGTEQMAQQILQVAGRAGRAQHAGEVLIQSSQPESVVLHTLVTQGYKAFSRDCLKEREAAWLPPFAHMALLRAEAVHAGQAMQFLHDVKTHLSEHQDIMQLGPIPAPMERRAGRYRAQLLLQSQNRPALHQLLHEVRHYGENLKSSRSVRWSLDVDPTDMF